MLRRGCKSGMVSALLRDSVMVMVKWRKSAVPYDGDDAMLHRSIFIASLTTFLYMRHLKKIAAI